MAFGYRSREIPSLSSRPLPAEGVKFTHKIPIVEQRKPVARSTGCPLLGALPPHADGDDADTMLDGVNKRMGAKMPPVPPMRKRRFLREMRKFVRKEIKRYGIKKIKVDKRWTLEEYLAHTNYPEWRKEELRKYKDEVEHLLERGKYGELINFTIKLFMKDEHYVEYKHARGIYARDEAAKLFFGPWFKLMEKEVYKLPEFIKHVPVAKRAKYISRRLVRDGAKYIATDYSSFEAHFVAELMDACEFELYRYMLSESQDCGEVLSVMQEVLMGKNTVINKFVKGHVHARRMSGEMNTSLGNGWSNLMFMNFVCSKNNLKYVNGVVEGDDGLFSFIGNTPTTEMFTSLGFNIKLQEYASVNTAGFCGQLFDDQDLQIVTDPFKVAGLFGWTTARYARSNKNKLKLLLRCKSLSMAHQYPGCPVIGALAQYGLRMTRSFDVSGFIERRRDVNLYEYEKLKEALADKSVRTYVEPGMGTRLLFEELYNISVEEQIKIEKYLMSKEDLTPLNIPCLSENSPADWRHYYDNYVFSMEELGADLTQDFHVAACA